MVCRTGVWTHVLGGNETHQRENFKPAVVAGGALAFASHVTVACGPTKYGWVKTILVVAC